MRSAGPVVHLHNHTGYSVLDGAQKLPEMCEAAAADGQPAIAVTDHDSLGASWKFNSAAHAAGIKPILGVEAYLSIGNRHEQNSEIVPRDDDDVVDTDIDEGDTGKVVAKDKTKRYQHLTVLVENAKGWSNLVAANNASHDTLWYKPRMDFDLLAQHAEGLIILTGCLGGPVANYLSRGMDEVAEANLRTLIDNHGAQNVYVEVMDHGITVERKVMPGLARLAKKYKLPIVATNDAHYTRADQAGDHDCWLCTSQKRGNKQVLQSATDRFKFNGSGYHLRTAAEMRALFDDQDGFEDAVNNTLLIAERIEDNVLPAPRLRLPKFPCPDGLSAQQYLHQLTLEGARERWGSPLPAAVKARLRFEEDVIAKAGLEDYFLIVWDVIRAVRAAGHRVGYGRGSAAGSAISYALRITGIDPLRHNLLFERFLNPDRTGMPDIDIDLDGPGREFAILYTIRKYGQDLVAKIGTYSLALSKRAVKEVARVTGVAPVGAKMASLIPVVAGKPLTFAKLLDPENDRGRPFREFVDHDPTAPDVLTTARTVEGVVAGESVHACGLLISDEPMNNFVPLRHERKKVNGKMVDTGVLVTQWDGKDVDKAGLLKIDYLGLRNLSVISEAVRLIEETTGEKITDDSIPDYDDAENPRVRAVWHLLAQGKTAGVFQLESQGITKLTEAIGPESLEDISAILALYRPGPMGGGMHDRYAARKAGKEPVDYDYLTSDPAEQKIIASVLDETYGVIVYQEQLMTLAKLVAGFNPAESNALQKAFSKKLKEEMDLVGEWFLAGGVAATTADDAGHLATPAFRPATVEQLWGTFKASADYLFNKSHSAGYGYITYVTGYLKANWPAQYGAALLSVTEGEDGRLPMLQSLAAEGIPVLCPDVNIGGVKTSVDAGGNIRLGISEIKGVGKDSAAIVAEREANGPFTSLADLVIRVKVENEETGKLSAISLGLVQGLIEAGACDSFGPRMGMMAMLKILREYPEAEMPDIEWGVIERSQRERQRLSVITSTHPLKALGQQLHQWAEPHRRARPVQIHRITAGDGDYISTLGVVSSFATRSYAGGTMASMVLEGSKGSIECVMWDELLKTLQATDTMPQIGEVVGVTGKIKVRRFTITLHSDTMTSGAEDSLEGDEDEAAMVMTEEVERRNLSVQSLWRGELTDTAGDIPRLAQVIAIRPGTPPAPAPAKPRAARIANRSVAVSTGQGALTAVDDADETGPLPSRREDAGPAVVLNVKQGVAITQIGHGPDGFPRFCRAVPAMADPEVRVKLDDWLRQARIGDRSEEFICVDGSAVLFECTQARSSKIAVTRFLSRFEILLRTG